MAVKHLETNSVVKIEFSNAEFALGVILHVSNMENVVLLGVYGAGIEEASSLNDEFESLVYTYADSIMDGEWPVVAKVDITNPERFSYRIIGNAVWAGDKKIRAANKEDSQKYPIQRIAGTAAAEKYIYFLKYGGEEKAFFKMNSKAMKSYLNSV